MESARTHFSQCRQIGMHSSPHFTMSPQWISHTLFFLCPHANASHIFQTSTPYTQHIYTNDEYTQYKGTHASLTHKHTPIKRSQKSTHRHTYKYSHNTSSRPEEPHHHMSEILGEAERSNERLAVLGVAEF